MLTRPWSADPRRHGGERPVERVADDRARRSRRGGSAASAQRRQAEAGDAQDREVVARVEERRRSPARSGGCAADLDRRVALAGDDVRVGHDLSGADDPARALDAETARRADDAHDAPRRATRRPARARRRRGGGATGGRGPAIAGSGSIRASALSTTPDGGMQLVEAPQDRRALDVAAQRAAVARQREHDHAEHPGDAERDGGAEQRAGERRRATPEQRQRAARAAARTPTPSKPGREDRTGGQRAEQPERPARRARRCPPAAARRRGACRRSRRARSRASESAPDDEAAHVAGHGEQHRRGEDQPVETVMARASVLRPALDCCARRWRSLPTLSGGLLSCLGRIEELDPARSAPRAS